MIIEFEDDSEDYELLISDWGDNPMRVFLLVKQATGRSTADMRLIFNENSPVVMVGSKRELTIFSIDLQREGAKTSFRLRGHGS